MTGWRVSDDDNRRASTDGKWVLLRHPGGCLRNPCGCWSVFCNDGEVCCEPTLSRAFATVNRLEEAAERRNL